MAVDNRQSPITLGTIITVVTMIAGLAGTWSVMGERIRSAGDDVRELRVQLSELQHRMSAAERDNATDDIRIQNLQEAISDLRPRGR